MADFKVTASRGEYQGKPTLVLSSGDSDKYPFTFGLQKAKRILACIDDIKAFVADLDKPAEAKPTENKVAVK